MTIQSVAVNQDSAGTTTLVTVSASEAVTVVSYFLVLSATGTYQFAGLSNLTGDVPVDAKGGVVVAGRPESPVFVLPRGNNLSIVTTGGAAKGHLSYFIS